MPQILDTLQQSLTPNMVQKISRQLGVDQQTAQQGINVALPLLVSALSRNAAQPDGADALANAVQRDHDGSVIDQPDQAIQRYESGEGGKILGHIFGDNRGNLEQTISQGTGLDAGALLQILAPLVLGALAKQMQSGQVDRNSLPEQLQREKQQYENQNGNLMGMLTSLLDSNKDGSAFDDVAGMLGRMLQQNTRR